MLQKQQSLVRLEKAGVERAGRWLVRDIDLEVERGEIVTLIGPNGSGKSTTARMALGVIPPDEGISWRAPDLRVGYVPQKVAVDWTLPLTVGRFLALTNPLTREEKASALESTGIAHLEEAEVRNLSGGEFQRALLARAVARRPDLLVLDEPVQGVDFNGEIALYEMIANIRNYLHCGVLLISHDLHVVMAATDRVLCLNGHVCCHGTPQVVAESPEYRQLFGTRGAAQLAVYQHNHDHTHLPDGTVRHADGTVTEHCHPGDGHHHDHDHDHGDEAGKRSEPDAR